MTESHHTRYYEEGDAAYERGELLTALRWWLLGVDHGDSESLNAAIEISQTPDAQADDPWNQLMASMKTVYESPVALALQARFFDETADNVARVLDIDPVAPWSQFSMGPVDDLTLLALPVIAGADPIANSDDEDWLRVIDVLEESDVTFQPLGCNVLVGMWSSDFDFSIPVMFGIDPPETSPRKFRIFSPLLIGLPAPEMAPNLEAESGLPQAGFSIPLRPMQTLFARACMALAEVGIISWMPMLRFGADLPEEDRPLPRIAVGFSQWIVGPTAVHRLRYPLPQVSVGYEIDLSLSGPHLKAALAGAVDSVVAAAAKTAEANKRNAGVFCEYITSIALPYAAEQWSELFAEMAYPPELSEMCVWADMGLSSAMFDLATALSQMPDLELDSYQWFDRAIGQGYSPALASATWMMLCKGSFDSAVEVWERGQGPCQTALTDASAEDRDLLARNLRNAQGNAAVAESLRSRDPGCVTTWRHLSQQGHPESLIHEHVSTLMARSFGPEPDYRSIASLVSQQLAPGDWVTDVYVTFAEGLAAGTGPFQEWCRHGVEICRAMGTRLRALNDEIAHRSRNSARRLMDLGHGSLAEPLQEAATRFGLPYAGADHSWRMLSESRFGEAIALYEEVSPAIDTRLAEVVASSPEMSETWEKERANYQSNIALCRIALGEGYGWALDVWRSGARTGNVESIFYPAVVALRSGDIEAARQIVDSMEGSKIAEMTSIALEGSRSSTPFWREWSVDGLRLLQSQDPVGLSGARPSEGLGGLKSSSGLGVSPLGGLGSTRGGSDGAVMYRFCPNCGTERLPDGRFCGSCGFSYG